MSPFSILGPRRGLDWRMEGQTAAEVRSGAELGLRVRLETVNGDWWCLVDLNGNRVYAACLETRVLDVAKLRAVLRVRYLRLVRTA